MDTTCPRFLYSFSSDRYGQDVHHHLHSTRTGRVFYAFHEMPEWFDLYDGVDGPSSSSSTRM